MRLHPTTGAGALGIATNISVNGVVPPTLVGVGAQLPRWINPAGNVLLFFNVTAGNLQQIDLDTNVVTTVAPGGAVGLAAGNSLYVASLSSGALQGVRSNISGWTTLPLAGLGDMDENGDFAVIQAFAADRGVSLYSSAGVLIQTIDIPISPGGVIRCKTGLCAFTGSASSWQLRSLADGSAVPFADRTEGVIETVPIEMASGDIWVIERTGNDTLTARRATDNQGYVISSTIVYNPDVMELTPGVLRIGWSATAGEGPTALRMADLTVGTGVQTLWSTSTGTLVSSAGPTLPVASLPATATGTGLAALFAGHHPFTDQKSGMLTLGFGKPWVDLVSRTLGQPINLATQTTGVLGPAQGGTGGTGGTSVINASNITIGQLPPHVFIGAGYWAPLCAGSAYYVPDLVQNAGSWSLLTNGDPVTPELMWDSNGDVITTWTVGTGPYLAPIVVSDNATVTVWVPTP